ncbi:BatD family protein [Acidobacteriota bacterium]
MHPAEVRVNDAVTLTLTVKGQGNIKTIEEPALPSLGDFRSYTAKSSDEINTKGGKVFGTKIWEYVLVPTAPGDQVIPPAKLAYFDPQDSRYKVAATEPLSLKVEKGDGEGIAAFNGREVAKQEIKLVQQDINYIQLELGNLQRPDEMPVNRLVFLGILIGPILVNIGVFAYARERDRTKSDAVLARYRKAGSQAKGAIRAAGKTIDARTPGPFYAALSVGLIGYVADKFNQPAAGLTKSDIRDLLVDSTIDENAVSKLLGFLEQCERIRFAPIATNYNTMRRHLKETFRWIRFLEKRIRLTAQANRE